MTRQTETNEPQRGQAVPRSILVTLAIVLSLAACGLMLLIPTRSISVTTVYKGF